MEPAALIKSLFGEHDKLLCFVDHVVAQVRGVRPCARNTSRRQLCFHARAGAGVEHRRRVPSPVCHAREIAGGGIGLGTARAGGVAGPPFADRSTGPAALTRAAQVAILLGSFVMDYERTIIQLCRQLVPRRVILCCACTDQEHKYHPITPSRRAIRCASVCCRSGRHSAHPGHVGPAIWHVGLQPWFEPVQRVMAPTQARPPLRVTAIARSRRCCSGLRPTRPANRAPPPPRPQRQ